MSIVILRNKANPAITRQFPLAAWNTLDKSLPLKKEWEIDTTLDGLPVQAEAKPVKAPSFIPPEIEGLKLGADGKNIVAAEGEKPKRSNGQAANKEPLKKAKAK